MCENGWEYSTTEQWKDDDNSILLECIDTIGSPLEMVHGAEGITEEILGTF